MPEYYSTDDVVKDKFLFISYCHEDKQAVEACAKYLLDQGVRLWYDKALSATDEWPTVVEDTLRHENCCGAFLFCSPAALASKNVAKERRIALEEREKRSVKEYPVFFVVVTRDRPVSYMQLIQQTFHQIDPSRLDDVFPLENLHVLLKLIGNDAIYRMTHIEGYEQLLLEDVRKLVPQAVSKNVRLREAMESQGSANKIVTLDFGSWPETGASEPLKWHFLGEENDMGTLLCSRVLTESLGGSAAEDWLAGEFLSKAFSPEEQGLLSGKPRLLKSAELGTIDSKILSTGQQWWLTETRGNLQMIIREDGTLYRNGYNNKTFEKGIRPVITMRMSNISNLVLK